MIESKGLQLNRFRNYDVVIFPLDEKNATVIEEVCKKATLVETLGNLPKIRQANQILSDMYISVGRVLAVGKPEEITSETINKLMPRKSSYGSNYFCHAVGRYGSFNVELHSCAKDAFTCVLKTLRNPKYVIIVELERDKTPYEYRTYDFS